MDLFLCLMCCVSGWGKMLFTNRLTRKSEQQIKSDYEDFVDMRGRMSEAIYIKPLNLAKNCLTLERFLMS